TSTEETMASGMARAAISYLEEIADETTMPATGGTVSLHPSSKPPTGDLWDQAAGSLVNPADPRFAWTVLYRRDDPTNRFAQVYLFTVQSRNRPRFDSLNDTTQPVRDGKPYPASLEPKAVIVTIAKGNPDRIQLNPAAD